MDKKATGGPAFPQPAVISDAGDILTSMDFDEGGMTIRDYFAAKAMQALITAKIPQMEQVARGWPVFAERDAWKIADAMLAERNK